MLVDTHGLYALRLQKSDTKKDIALVGPENLTFNVETKEFVGFIPCEEAEESPKIIEFYIRKKAETIEYKQQRKEKINLNHLELAMRYQCIPHPSSKDIKRRSRGQGKEGTQKN